MTEYTAFFYGTLMAPGVLHRVIHGTPSPEQWQQDLLTIRPAMLPGHRRHKVRYAQYPAIIPHRDSQVRGNLVTGLTEGDIWRLDLFEGDQYRREIVKVQVLKDVALDQAAPEHPSEGDVVEEVEAQTYIWIEGSDSLEPEEWDFEAFKRENMRAWMGLDDDGDGEVEVDEGFADVDRAVAEVEGRQKGEKPDPMGGRGANGHITKQLKEAAV